MVKLKTVAITATKKPGSIVVTNPIINEGKGNNKLIADNDVFVLAQMFAAIAQKAAGELKNMLDSFPPEQRAELEKSVRHTLNLLTPAGSN